MRDIRDYMFGVKILPDKRLEQHRALGNGVKHRSDVSPARPNTSDPIIISPVTSGTMSFDAVIALYTTNGSAPGFLIWLSINKVRARTNWDQVDWRLRQACSLLLLTPQPFLDQEIRSFL